MKTPVMQSSKICANCAFWAGEREMNGFFERMEVDISCNPKGKCVNRQGLMNQTMNWNATCSHFYKHPVVK